MMLAMVAVIYSWSFLHQEDGLDKYYTLLLLVVTSALGMELTGDLFNFFVFLEISCIASCALIAFWVIPTKRAKTGTRRSRRMAHR